MERRVDCRSDVVTRDYIVSARFVRFCFSKRELELGAVLDGDVWLDDDGLRVDEDVLH